MGLKTTLLALTLFVALIGSCVSINGQVVDADGNFEAVHHDIGRITSPSSPAVAGATVVRTAPSVVEQPAHRSAPAVNQPAPRRKATRRVTYAVKPHVQPALAPIVEEPVLAAQPAIVVEQPAPVPVARHVSHRQQAARVVQEPPPLTFEPLPVDEQPQQQTPQTAFGQPAESFAAPLTLAPAPSHVAELPRQTPHFTARAVVSAPRIVESSLAAPALSTLEEPIPEPSFESVTASGCPAVGSFSWPNKAMCDRYYMCTNGTFTEEACPNGLSYSKLGAVYQHCAYNWNVDCGPRKSPTPVPSAGCDWQFGIFAHAPNQCSINYHVCEWGLPEVRQCKDGLFYDERIKGCQWADQLGCKSEPLLQFKCPLNDEDNQYYPFPRYYHSPSDIIVCVSDTPRLVHCNEDQFVDPNALACMDKHPKKKKLNIGAATNLNAVRF